MSDASLEQRLAALEAKVAAIEDWLLLSPPRKAGLLLMSRRPLPTPEGLAACEEVDSYICEARRADLAEIDKELQRERCDPGEA